MDSDENVTSICTVCRRTDKINAVSLDCDHVFCYPCIKGVAETTGACPLCRKEIGVEFNFQDHKIIGPTKIPSTKTGHYWFYEGFKGWWMYDADTNSQLEESFERGESSVTVFLAGHSYRIDLENKIQRRADGDGRSRKILRSTIRDVDSILGLSGLRSDDFKDCLELMKSASLDLIE